MILNTHFSRQVLILQKGVVHDYASFSCILMLVRKRKKVWNYFKVDNKDTRATSLTSSCCLYYYAFIKQWTFKKHVLYDNLILCKLNYDMDFETYLKTIFKAQRVIKGSLVKVQFIKNVLSQWNF